jgi:hypothetical protein
LTKSLKFISSFFHCNNLAYVILRIWFLNFRVAFQSIMATAAVGLAVQISKPGLFPKEQNTQLYGIFGGEIVLGVAALYFAFKKSEKKSHRD